MSTGMASKFFKTRPTRVASMVLKVTAILMVATLFLPWLCRNSGTSFQRLIGGGQANEPDEYIPSNNTRPKTETAPQQGDSKDAPADPVAKLIYDIRAAVKLASGGESNDTFGVEDRKVWEDQFPCRSRVELEGFYQKRKHVQYMPLNERWQEVLAEYAVLHRVCMSRVGDLKNYFLTKNESVNCRFLIAEAHYGLGNKILHVSSLLMYAVLSQRVILIPELTSMPSVMCQPFPGSSWSLPTEIHQAVIVDRRNPGELYDAVDEVMTRDRSMAVYASQSGDFWGPERRFWCNTEQSMLSTVTWLTIDGCVYFLPMLFSVEKFRPALEELFPTRVVSTHVLRTAMLPADHVWERVVDLMENELDGAEKLVGVQVRFLYGEQQYRDSNERVNDRVTQCLLQKGFLPEVCPTNFTENSTDDYGQFANCSSEESLPTASLDANVPTAAPITKVLIASLVLGFHDHLQDIYLDHETVDGAIVSILQPTHQERQDYGADVDSQALAEVMALSFSDDLLITPYSTFGGVAQAYGFLVPYFVEYRAEEEDGPCQRATSTEPCDLRGVAEYECRYDRQKNSDINATVPYLQRCMSIDVNQGYATLMMNQEGAVKA